MMSVKKMIDLYIANELSETTWNMMYQMRNHGLISWDNWTKFFNKCEGWSLSRDGQSVEDADGRIIYTRNADGFLVKVA